MTAAEMIDILAVFSFSQSVVQPTHVRGHVLDRVTCRSEVDGILHSTSVSQALTSDHYYLTCDLNVEYTGPCTSVNVLLTDNISCTRAFAIVEGT